MRLVLATANPDKAAEIRGILEGIELVERPPGLPEVEETGETLLENARLKAQAVAMASGQPAVADDTGLEVEALEGAPGVHAARFAGSDATYADNVAKLLRQLAAVDGSRRARFLTVALVAYPDGREVSATGAVEGTIATEARGSGGFGYDPVFVPDEGDGRTFAQMSPLDKHALSHRGRAFRQLAAALQQYGDEVPEYRIGQAADLLGVSPDTMRRWADAGRVKTSQGPTGRRVVDGVDLARFAVQLAAEHDQHWSHPKGSARNRFPGIVTRVERDKVAAKVEVQAGPHRLVALITAEAVDELGLAPGVMAEAVVKATNVTIELPL